MNFVQLDLADMELPRRHQALLSVVAPRPIALTASLDRAGRCNLSPFSYFNAFGASPVTIAISPANSGRDGRPKDTALNIRETGEFTVSIVSHAMTEQANLASSEYPRGIDEFEKSGFTKRPSTRVKPPGVFESPAILECRLIREIELGGQPGSGNLFIAEVLLMHVRENVLDADGRIDPFKVDPVARMGYDWYSRARDGLFRLAKPAGRGVGFDQLPRVVRESPFLTGNDLGRLASVSEIPPVQEPSPGYRAMLEEAYERSMESFHLLIRDRIRQNRLDAAWEAVHFLVQKKEGEAA